MTVGLMLVFLVFGAILTVGLLVAGISSKKTWLIILSIFPLILSALPLIYIFLAFGVH